MQKGRDPMYSKCKQSLYNRWVKDLVRTLWVDWESTDEYDTDIDTATEKKCGRLQQRVMQFQSLMTEQLPGAVIAKVVRELLLPVVVALAEATDVSAVGPGSTMGPGTPVPSEVMPLVLDAEERANEKEAAKQRRLQETFQHATDSVDSKDLDDMQEK